jgi:DNA-directed RNA polymerase subunit RPC12/RpoP
LPASFIILIEIKTPTTHS